MKKIGIIGGGIAGLILKNRGVVEIFPEEKDFWIYEQDLEGQIATGQKKG